MLSGAGRCKRTAEQLELWRKLPAIVSVQLIVSLLNPIEAAYVSETQVALSHIHKCWRQIGKLQNTASVSENRFVSVEAERTNAADHRKSNT